MVSTDSTGFVVIRGTLFTAILLVVGVGAFQHLTLPVVRRRGSSAGLAVAEPASRRATLIALVASCLLLAAILGRLAGRLDATTAVGGGITAALATTIFHTTWGWAWLLQLSATLLAIVTYSLVWRGGHSQAKSGTTTAAVVALLVLALTPALSGHAVAAPHYAAAAIVAGGIHVLGASGWLGTLAVIVLAGVPAARQLSPADRGPAVTELVNAFSPAALVCAALVLVTGTFVGWVHMGFGPALWRTEYGQLLLIKLGVLGVVAGIGAYNWRVVRPSLGTEAGTDRLRRYATLELLAAIVVIVLTAVLVATPVPSQMGVAS